jgi:hypothetical protein
LSLHGSLFPDAFSINAHTHFVSDFEQFGDLNTKMELKGGSKNQTSNQRRYTLQLISQDRLITPLYHFFI